MAFSFASPVSNAFGLSDVGDYAAPVFADIDNDGDLDAFVGNFLGDTVHFQNNGTATAASFILIAAPRANALGLSNVGTRAAPSFADLDGDGDLDALVGERNGALLYFQNSGTATLASFDSPITNPFGLITAPLAFHANPTLTDLDGDSDFDVFVGTTFGDTVYFENTGTAFTASFAAPITNPFGLSDVGGYAKPTFADIDGDSDLDALVGTTFGGMLYFENTGTATTASFAAPITNPFGLVDPGGSRSKPTLVDLDGDGDQDLLVGNSTGNTLYFEHLRVLELTLTAPTAIAYTDTALDDSFTTASATLSATDPEGDTLTYGLQGGTLNGTTVTRSGTYGTLSLNTASGAYTYTPNDAAIEASSANVSEDFTVSASDGTNSVTQTLTVNLTQNGTTETTGNDVLTGSAGAERFDALAGNDTVYGLGGDDTLLGGAGNDSLDGGSGNDTLTGGAGSDTYIVDSSADLIRETATSTTDIDTVRAAMTYTLSDKLERLTLTGTGNTKGNGNALENVITGNTGNNVMAGGAGEDTLFGSAGDDRLTGGNGNDWFMFNAISSTNRDTVTDFIKGTDKIVLDDDVYAKLGTGTLSGKTVDAGNYRVGTKAGDSNDYLIYDPATDKLYYDADGNGSGVAKHIATISLTGTAAPTASDFLLLG